jgi:glutamyl-tRNA synthetase
LIENPSKEDYEKILQQTCESLGIKKAKIIHPIRLAVSGIGTGPGLYDILYIIGKQKTIERIRKAVEKIKK